VVRNDKGFLAPLQSEETLRHAVSLRKSLSSDEDFGSGFSEAIASYNIRFLNIRIVLMCLTGRNGTEVLPDGAGVVVRLENVF
jgi:hypothetical protein